MTDVSKVLNPTINVSGTSSYPIESVTAFESLECLPNVAHSGQVASVSSPKSNAENTNTMLLSSGPNNMSILVIE